MAVIIKQRKIVPDTWRLLKLAADGSLPAIPPLADVIVPLALWQARREPLRLRIGRLGVWLDSDQDPALMADDLDHFQVVAVNFPRFTDGRGYSTARLLRERYRYSGELRAIGDVQRDQLLYLSRCGFDAFSLRADQNPEQALAALEGFSEAYQSSVEQPLPLFRRRLQGMAKF